MQENLNITKENALKTYDKASTEEKLFMERLFGKKVFQKNLLERINNFNDICVEVGTTEKEFKAKHKDLDENTYSFLQTKLITEVLNEGWTPDWNNSNEYKYYIWWDMKKACFDVCFYYYECSVVPSRLCFKESKLVEFAANKFKDIYNKYFLG